MRDRIPKYAGRIKLIPVSNQPNTYDMQRADEPLQEGTPLNRNTLLSDQTVEEFGLSLDATPDEAMRFLNTRRKEFEQDINNTVDTFIKNATDILEKDFRIATGSFAGRANEKTTLAFDFTPSLIIITTRILPAELTVVSGDVQYTFYGEYFYMTIPTVFVNGEVNIYVNKSAKFDYVAFGGKTYEETVTFSVRNTHTGITETHTVARGTTWGEWAETSDIYKVFDENSGYINRVGTNRYDFITYRSTQYVRANSMITDDDFVTHNPVN